MKTWSLKKRKSERLKAAIFDIDDTLISEHAFMLSGYRAVSKKLEELLPDIWQDIYERLIELSEESPRNIFNRLLDTYHLYYDEDDIKELVDIYRNHMPDISFHDDVLPTLNALKKRGIRTGIISDGIPLTQHNKIHACGGESYFDRIIITDELGGEAYRKPDPRSFDMMAGSLGTDISQMLYIGDNPEKDFFIMHDRPIKTARIVREDSIYSGRQYRGGIRESFRLNSLTDILDII